MSFRLSPWSFLKRRTETHTWLWPSHFLRRVTFSLSLSVSPSALRRCGDKISIPFPPLLLPPLTAGQEVRTTGTEERRERKRNKKERREQKKTLREKAWERRGDKETNRKQSVTVKGDRKTKTKRCNERETREKEKYSKWTGCRLVERIWGENIPSRDSYHHDNPLLSPLLSRCMMNSCYFSGPQHGQNIHSLLVWKSICE